MKDVLEQEITGAPVTVQIRGRGWPLGYTLHALILYKQRTGDSLFLAENFAKIDLTTDPEKWLACLWAGLHSQKDGKWSAPFTIEELGALVDFSNAGEISVNMARALAQSLPKPQKDVLPNVTAPELTETQLPAHTSPASTGSTPELVAVSDSAEQSS